MARDGEVPSSASISSVIDVQFIVEEASYLTYKITIADQMFLNISGSIEEMLHAWPRSAIK